jgi:hypothetical protein
MPSIAIDRLDGLSSATALKGPCKAATTANTSLMGEQTIDGVYCVTSDRVLVKNQTDARANGIYVVDTGNWARAKDFARGRDIRNGSQVYVHSGDVGSGWYGVTAVDPVVLGVANITFAVSNAGPQGETGETGPANTLTIGTVEDGAEADATITGAAPNQTLNLVLPRSSDGTDGADGWSPVLAVATDDARRVLQVTDWVGGDGAKPATGLYVGVAGLTATIGDGVDVRGPAGVGDLQASANLSDLANVLTARTNLKIVALAQSAYDALDPPDADTIYIRTPDP